MPGLGFQSRSRDSRTSLDSMLGAKVALFRDAGFAVARQVTIGLLPASKRGAFRMISC